MEDIKSIVKDMATRIGAAGVGVNTLETLSGGPPSTDIRAVLPSANSAITLAVALNQDFIDDYLSKKDHAAHETDNVRTNTLANGMALEIAEFLCQKGFPSKALTANNVYRNDKVHTPAQMLPPISHRYLAARCGLGAFGFSGNILSPQHGAAIILNSVVTSVALEPDAPLPQEQNYCDHCKLCLASCASGFMSNKETTDVNIGGVKLSYSKRLDYNRCGFVCGGFSGLHKSGKWSTWSPARFSIPEKDGQFRLAIIQALPAYLKRLRPTGGFYYPYIPGNRLEYTCGHCQLVCHPDKEKRKYRYGMIQRSGVVIQHEDGRREAVAPKEAIEHLDKMKPQTRALFE